MPIKDPYETLGVAKNASQDEIKKAYRGLAKSLHPDLNPGNKAYESKFKEVSHAYEILSTPESRAKFDRGETQEQMQAQAEQAAQNRTYYSDTQQGGGRYSQNFGEGFDPNDLFESMFRQSGARGRRQHTSDTPGEDVLYQMEVEFRDAALGAEREITLPGGKKLLVKIPAGIEPGVRLRFKGMGGAGSGNGPAGDAYVQVSVRPLAGFLRVGKNIEVELPITFQEGILGTEVKIPTLEGSVLLTVPPGANNGTRLRIKGKGAGAGDSRGDQIAVLKVLLPKKPDPALQEEIRKWGTRFDYNPRETS